MARPGFARGAASGGGGAAQRLEAEIFARAKADEDDSRRLQLAQSMDDGGFLRAARQFAGAAHRGERAIQFGIERGGWSFQRVILAAFKDAHDNGVGGSGGNGGACNADVHKQNGSSYSSRNTVL